MTSVSKTCNKCGIVQALECFGIRSKSSGQRQSICRACSSNYNADRYLAKRERLLADAIAWQSANRERVRSNVRTYSASHGMQRSLRAHGRRVQERTFPAVRAADYAMKSEMFGGKCWMCGEKAQSIDHVKPISKGGSHLLANLRPACLACNTRKAAKWFGPAELAKFIKN